MLRADHGEKISRLWAMRNLGTLMQHSPLVGAWEPPSVNPVEVVWEKAHSTE